MAILLLDALPPKTTRGTIVRLLIQVGNLDKGKVGKISLEGRRATVEVPDQAIATLIKRIDGTALGLQNIRASMVSDRPRSTSSQDENHFDRLLGLLELEAEAEAEQMLKLVQRSTPQQAEGSGITLIRMNVADVEPGLGGRMMVTLQKASQDRLPWTRLGVGTPVVLSGTIVEKGARKSSPDRQRGVVAELRQRTLQLALDGDVPVSEDGTYRIDLSFDEVARQRQVAALQRAKTASGDRLSKLRSVLVDGKDASFGKIRNDSEAAEMLNESQCEAVRFAVSAEDMAIIHGPPGTGKTTTVIEVIRQLIEREETVLACAPSNMAVDNLFEKLLKAGIRTVRIGHPARVLPELRDHTLDMLVDTHPDMKLARKFAKEAYKLRERANRFTRARPDPNARKEMRTEARELIADAKRLEAQVVGDILDRAQVICSTTTALDSELLGQRSFDVAVIDEACQTTEPACWIPLLRCDRLVIAGDHCQLPPTVLSREASKQGFDVSLQQRLLELHGTSVSRQLVVQYRMHNDIMQFSNSEFYDGTLEAAESVAAHSLPDDSDVQESEWTSQPVWFVDTAGAGYDEEIEPDGESRRNPQEATVVEKWLRQLLDHGVPEGSIGVITPYAAQVRWMREQMTYEGIEIDTVDGFQGREKDVVLISLVRSNARQEIGFLKDFRRMNVAMTRARKLLVVIGDSSTIGVEPFYQRMLEYFESCGAYHTVWEEAFQD